ncbi:MAG: hypothetical protein ING73_00770 [Rhodocyclaceae bacterium]|nr:hypothetical protein [Rhodocyclaceae bacterium]
MTTLAERVAECLAEVADRLKVKESAAKTLLARAVGIKPPSVYDWLNGTTKKLEGGNLNRAAAFFGVEPDWLETGTGAKRLPETSGDWPSTANDILFDGAKALAKHDVQENLKGYDAHADGAALAEPMFTPSPAGRLQSGSDRYVYIPAYNVTGGMGSGRPSAHEEIEGRHSYSQAWLNREALSVQNLVRMKGEGDSMLPTIADGDALLINKAERKIISGKVFAFRVGDELRVKRLFRQLDGRVRVVSDNPDKALYPDEFLSIDDTPEIIGRVRERSGKNGL